MARVPRTWGARRPRSISAGRSPICWRWGREAPAMSGFLHQLALGAPLFALILTGYLLMRVGRWPPAMSQHLTRFVFSVGLPAMLFRMMSDLSHLPPVDGRLLIAFFGACLGVFVLGRLLAARLFGLDGTGQTVFGIGCIFSNNGMLGLPLVKAYLGDEAIPSVALVLVFNALTLWTLISVSAEWYRHGQFSAAADDARRHCGP